VVRGGQRGNGGTMITGVHSSIGGARPVFHSSQVEVVKQHTAFFVPFISSNFQADKELIG